jgi:hypothetical protein
MYIEVHLDFRANLVKNPSCTQLMPGGDGRDMGGA